MVVYVGPSGYWNLQTPLFIQGIRLYAPFDKADILVCPGAQLRDFGFRPGFRV